MSPNNNTRYKHQTTENPVTNGKHQKEDFARINILTIMQNNKYMSDKLNSNKSVSILIKRLFFL